MNLQLKNIKHSEFASQETHCYEATLCLDGKAVAVVGNDGHGGCDSVGPAKNIDSGVYCAAMKSIKDYFAGLPKEDAGFLGADKKPVMMQPDLEIWCGDQINQWLAIRDMKRTLKKAVAFTKSPDDSGVFSVKVKAGDSVERVIAWVKSKHPAATVLNELPEDQAIKFWTAGNNG